LGDPTAPDYSYVRFRLKDADGEGAYFSPGTPVVRDEWFKLETRPVTDGDFDASKVTRIEVEFGTESLETIHQGKIYIDTCGWQEIDPPGEQAATACLDPRAGDGPCRR
jgi:hypothetical protein